MIVVWWGFLYQITKWSWSFELHIIYHMYKYKYILDHVVMYEYIPVMYSTDQISDKQVQKYLKFHSFIVYHNLSKSRFQPKGRH